MKDTISVISTTDSKIEQQEAAPLDERILQKVENLLYVLCVRALREQDDDSSKQ